MKILTIIIPSYNTEKFIDRNMKYFLDNRLYNKCEVLLINDGSKDKTAEKAKKYAEKYKGYIRFIDKENAGHGSVINVGIHEAVGQYIKVVDADDWVNTENLVQLVSCLEKESVDLVINPFIQIDQQSGKSRLCTCDVSVPGGTVVPLKSLISDNVKLALHSVTYRTVVLRDHHIQLTEKCFYEDFQYTVYPLPYINSVLVLDYPIYNYLVGQKSQSVDAANALKNINMCIKVFRDSVEHFNSISGQLDADMGAYIDKQICIFLRSMYNIFLRNSRVDGIMECMHELDKRIKKISKKYYEMVGDNNFYIRIMRSGNILSFRILSLVFKIYKYIAR